MARSAGRSSVPSERRIFSLVLALVASAEGSTKSTLLSSVYGYSDRYVPNDANASLERQFERDKEQLRSLGIHIETLDSPLEPGNNQLTRYRVAKERLQFPSDLRFSERELMLLRLAALAWSEGSLSAEARRALMKLESLGAGLDVQYLGIAPKLGSAEPAAAPLQTAIDSGSIVRFAYTNPNRNEPLDRRVAPLRLHRLDGRWHLIAWDLDRDAGRVFLLSRISGTVQHEKTQFDPALRAHSEDSIAALLERREHNRARLEVKRGTSAEARLAPRAMGDARAGVTTENGVVGEPRTAMLTLGMLDPHMLATELVSYGADVTVHAPAELRNLVVRKLRAIVEVHSGGASG